MAVKVIDWPKTAGLAEEASVNVVTAAPATLAPNPPSRANMATSTDTAADTTMRRFNILTSIPLMTLQPYGRPMLSEAIAQNGKEHQHNNDGTNEAKDGR